jgi:hypothetical protein
MEFIQVIEVRTSKLDEMRALDEWAELADGPPSFLDLDVVDDRS